MSEWLFGRDGRVGEAFELNRLVGVSCQHMLERGLLRGA